MRRGLRLLAAICLLGASCAGGVTADRAAAPDRVSRAAPGTAPMHFETNLGQTHERFDFIARSGPLSAGISAEGFTLLGPEHSPRAVFVGADGDAEGRAAHGLELVTSYLRGSDPSDWVRDVPSYGEVRYQDVYPGIDVVYHHRRGSLEFDLEIAPGVDPAAVALTLQGGDVELTADGRIRSSLPGRELWLERPIAYQPDGTSVEVSYRLVDRRTVAFTTGSYDRSQALVIDPIVSYSTFIGGSSLDTITAPVPLDAAGNAYVAGRTTSVDIPISSPIEGDSPGADDVFVMKVAPDGSAPAWAVYLGGSQADIPFGIELDTEGNVFLTGLTCSDDFPVTEGVIQTGRSSECDSFVTKLSPDGTEVIYSTYLGGPGLDRAEGIALNENGAAFLVGETSSEKRIRGGFQQVYAGGKRDAFVAKISPNGRKLGYFTFLGGKGNDRGRGIALDPEGRPVVTGFTDSSDFPVHAALQPRKAGPSSAQNFSAHDAFVTKLNKEGDKLKWSTFFGGIDGEAGFTTKVDQAGNVFFGGRTQSLDMPVVNPAQPVFGGHAEGDGFLAKITPDGSELMFSTYLGGSGFDRIFGMALDAAGTPSVVGRTDSRDLALRDEVQSIYGGGFSDAMVAKLSPDGSEIRFLSYLGGGGYDRGFGLGSDAVGNLFVTGQTDSPDFPIIDGMQEEYAGTTDGFLFRLSFCECN